MEIKIKELRFTKSLTVNLGNYESAKVECGLVADIGDSRSTPSAKDVQDAFLDLSNYVEGKLHEELVALEYIKEDD